MYNSKMFLPDTVRRIGDGEIDLDKVAEFIKSNNQDEKVQKFVSTVRPINEDAVKSFLETDENGQKLSKSLFDKRVNEAVLNHDKRFKEEKLPNILDEEREKIRLELNPKESEVEKQLRLSQERIQKLEQKEKYNNLKNTAIDLINEMELPFLKIVDKFIGEDEDATVSNIQAFKDIWDNKLTEAVQKKIADSNGRDIKETDSKNQKSLETQLDEAKKAGNLKEVIRLKNIIHDKALKEASEKNS